MVKQNLVVIFFCFLFSLKAVSIPLACEIKKSGLLFNASDISKGNISFKLDKVWKEGDILFIKNEVAACRSLILGNINERQDRISELLKEKATILGHINIKDTRQRLKTLKKEREGIKQTFARGLEQIHFSGLYAAVVDASVERSESYLIEAAKMRLTPRAIEDLRGVAIKSATVVKDARIVFDRIIGKTSGEMDIEHAALEDRKFYKGRTQFVYVAVARIRPLKGRLASAGKTNQGEKGYVANLLSDKGMSSFKRALTGFTNTTYAGSVSAQLNQIFETWQNIVNLTNERALRKENSLFKELSASLRQKEKQIEIAGNELKTARKQLKLVYDQIGFICNEEPESCIDRAIQQIESQIGSEIQKSLDEKEKELIFADAEVPGEGEPIKEISQTARAMYNNLKTNYGTREQFLSFTEVNYGSVAQTKEERGVFITRKPNTVMLYPFATADGHLRLFLVMGFEVFDGNDGGSSNSKVSEAKEVGRDGNLIADTAAVVHDRDSGLEWVAGPDRNITWNEAKQWVENLTVAGGGWRMPTRKELRTLYKKGAGNRNMTPLLKTSGWWVWAGETRDSSSAWFFYFNGGGGCEGWRGRGASDDARGFAVRCRRQ
jgi:Protein of unknown function (DUF1566)